MLDLNKLSTKELLTYLENINTELERQNASKTKRKEEEDSVVKEQIEKLEEIEKGIESLYQTFLTQYGLLMDFIHNEKMHLKYPSDKDIFPF